MAPRFTRRHADSCQSAGRIPLEIPAFPRHGINNRGYINFYPGSWSRELLLRESNRGTLALIQPRPWTTNPWQRSDVGCWDFLRRTSVGNFIRWCGYCGEQIYHFSPNFTRIFRYSSLWPDSLKLIDLNAPTVRLEAPLLFNSPVYVSRFEPTDSIHRICTFRSIFAVPLWSFCIILGSRW